MINKALKLVRQYHELSIAQLSSELDLPRDYLSQIESGNKPVDKKILSLYSTKFDIPVTSLVMFSESIKNEGKVAKKFRTVLVGKVIQIAEWKLKRHAKNTA